MKRMSLVLAASLIAALGLIGTAQAVLFSGNTNTSSPTAINIFLIYTSTSFSNINVPVGPGPTNFTDLGNFTLNVCSGINCNENFGIQGGLTDFTLRITFTDPILLGGPMTFAADIFGTISRSGNSNNIGNGSLLTIDLDNTAHHFTYSNALGSGGFDFSFNDPAPYTAASQFGNTRTLTGQIANLRLHTFRIASCGSSGACFHSFIGGGLGRASVSQKASAARQLRDRSVTDAPLLRNEKKAARLGTVAHC